MPRSQTKVLCLLPDNWWQKVDASPLVLSWQALAAITSISSIMVSVAVVYLRLFVENRLNSLRSSVVEAVEHQGERDYLAKNAGEMIAYRMTHMEERLDRIERFVEGVAQK